MKRYAQLLTLQDEIVEILLGLRRLADDDSPGDIRMVAFPDGAEIKGDEIAGFDDFRAGRTWGMAERLPDATIVVKDFSSEPKSGILLSRQATSSFSVTPGLMYGNKSAKARSAMLLALRVAFSSYGSFTARRRSNRRAGSRIRLRRKYFRT